MRRAGLLMLGLISFSIMNLGCLVSQFDSVIVHPLESAEMQQNVEQGKWTKKGDTPFESVQCAANAFDGEIYVFGGPHGGQNRVIKYNPDTDTWIRLADMPNPRQALASAEVNGKIYVFGDLMRSNLPVDVYDPIYGTWESKSVMPNCRGCLSAVAIGDEIYVLGGYKFSGNVSFADIDVYDTKTDNWKQRKPMPFILDSFVAQEMNGKIIIISGIVNNFRSTPEVWEYDPMEELWIKRANIPIPRAYASVFEIEGKLYIMGGSNLNSNWNGLQTFDVYDLANDTWTYTQNMPDASTGHIAAIVNNHIYRIGGMKLWGDPNPVSKIVYEYEPFIQPTTSVSPANKLLEQWGQIKVNSW